VTEGKGGLEKGREGFQGGIQWGSSLGEDLFESHLFPYNSRTGLEEEHRIHLRGIYVGGVKFLSMDGLAFHKVYLKVN